MSDEQDSPFKHLLTVIITNGQHATTRYHFGFRDHKYHALEQAATIAINGLRVRLRTGQTVFYPVHRVEEARVDVDLDQEDFDRLIEQGYHIYEP